MIRQAHFTVKIGLVFLLFILGTFIDPALSGDDEEQSFRSEAVLTPDGGGDIVAVADSKGRSVEITEAWVRIYNGPAEEEDQATSIVRDGSGNLYVTGSSPDIGTGADITTLAYDASGNELWVASYNGPGNDWDTAYDMVLGPSGNIYVVGESWNIDNDRDYTTIGYDTAGTELWVARYNGPGDGYDRGNAVAVDASDNIFITGESWGSGTDYDFATVAYDADGNELWTSRYDGPDNGYDGAQDVAVDTSGNVYVTGWSYNLDLDQSDFKTVAYDADGNELWVATYNGPADSIDQPLAIAADSSGQIYVTGLSTGIGTGRDATTVAYDTSGDELWVARYNGPGNDSDYARSIHVDGSGTIYVTGASIGDGTQLDYATIAYDTSGTELWVARYDTPLGSGNDYGWDVTTDAFGNVYVTGESYDGSFEFDCVTISYDASGNELWVGRYVTAGELEDWGDQIIADPSGNVYVAGVSYDPDFGNYLTLKYPAVTDPAVFSGEMAFDPPSPCAQGDMVTCTAKIHNQSTIDAENVEVAFYARNPLSGGILIGGTTPGNPQTIPLIPAGGSVDVSIIRKVPIIWSGDIYVWVDSPDDLAELDETNNLASSLISVGPDLTLDPSDITFVPDPGTAGSPVTVSAVIHNTGGQAILDPVRVRFFNGDPMSGGSALAVRVISGGIAAGDAETVMLSGVPPVSNTYDIYVWADHVDYIKKYDEDNNIASNTLVVNP